MQDTTIHIGFRLLAILGLVLVNGFFVAAEFALVTVRKTRVDQLVAEGNRTARALRRATMDPDSYIAATQLGITMASLGLGWLGEPALASVIEPAFAFLPTHIAAATTHTIAFAISFAIITALTIVVGELAPKTIALQHAEKTALYVIHPTEIFMKVFWPFIALLNAMGRHFVALFGLYAPSRHSLVHSEEELKMLVTASQEAGVLEETEEQMLHRVFNFADLTAGQVMVPRTEMLALPVDLPLAQVVERMSRGAHTRIPVYRGTLDDIVGILLATDLLRALSRPPERFTLAAIAREALVVPETMKADQLLAEMRRRRTRQAIVIDEYGGTAGLVTFERLMARIVGDIGGEFGATAGEIVEIPGGDARIDGLALVTDINERFDLHIDETLYTTMGGYVLGRLGRRAVVGDAIDVEGRTLRVEALDGLRVARVWLSRPRPAEEREDRHEE